ncbi:MAG: DUF846 domain-containing protein [archaeon]|nr:DUF846 domain-containing protein [archaeon]
MSNKPVNNFQEQQVSIQNTNINNSGNMAPQGQVGPGQEQIDFTNFLQHAHNPIIVFFTLIFKVLAILFYFLLGIFGVSDALIFIIVVILCAFDFWFIKNVSGRIIVGLRWWNEVKEDGSEVWIFESDHEKRATSIDTTIFWGSLYITPLFWGVLTILNLIGLRLIWFLVCLIALVLTGSNTIGYYKCSGEQKKKLTSFFVDKGQAGLSKLMSYGAKAMSNNSNNNQSNNP